jgi:acyl carrier protein
MLPEPREMAMKSHEQSELEKRVLAIFSRHLHSEVTSVETDLLESGILDSLKFVELLLALETELAVKLSVHELELENFRSVHAISNFIASQAGRTIMQLRVESETM